MNPVFRFIDWMLREHGALVSGPYRLCRDSAHRLVFGAAGGAEENEGKPYVHLGYTIANGVDGSSAHYSVGN
jgi:hypothetical protein